jgi:hypothetical protein
MPGWGAVMLRIALDEKGATLVELLFSTMILVVVTASFYQLLLAFYQNYQTQEETAEIQQQARVAGDLLSKEIESAGYDPKGLLFLSDRPNEERRTKPMSRVDCERISHPAERILEATPVLFHFLADLNGNAVVDDSVATEKDIDEDVRYEWVGASGIDSCGTRKTPFTLYRDTGGGGGGQEVALSIDHFNLAYFDESGRALPERALTQGERARIRKVVIALRVRSERRDPQDSSGEGYRTRQVTLEARLRNM